MRRVVARLSARIRPSVRAWVDRCLPGPAAPAPPHPSDHLIYRLKHWPRIPSASRTAEMLRTLSVMSHRPVNRRWILNHSGLGQREVDMLLRRLVEQGAVQVTDAGKYPRGI